MRGTVERFQLDGCLTFCHFPLILNSLPPSLVEIVTLPTTSTTLISVNVARCCFEFYFRIIEADIVIIAWVDHTCFVSTSHVSPPAANRGQGFQPQRRDHQRVGDTAYSSNRVRRFACGIATLG